MRYNSYLSNPEPLIRAYEFYVNTKLTQKEVCTKFKVCYHTFKSYIGKMRGGQLQKRNFSIEVKNQYNYENIKETSDNVFKKKEKTDKKHEIIDVMNDMGGRGRKNAHSGFTDVMENHKKNIEQKQQQQNINQNQPPKKKKVVSLDEMYNISGFLNEQDKIAKEND